MFSIDDEVRQLRPISVDETPMQRGDEPLAPSALGQWDALTKTLARMGKQQLRANQHTELTLQQAATALAQAEENSRLLREQCDEYRRELRRYQEEARETRLTALGTIDMLDDLMVMARQKGDPHWTTRVERLTARALDSLAQMGLAEIPAADRPFDEQVHEAVDAVDRGDREPYVVVEVIRRGFRYNGAVLRRAQVVATR